MNPSIDPSLEFEPGTMTAGDIGASLRASRLRRGDDLTQVAKILRIRYVYLDAIEDGRFYDLPGNAYTTGFIRTYSDYLGLDGAKIVKELKKEGAVTTDKPNLVFPAIIPENGIPGSVVVMVGLFIALMGYFGWYWLSAPDVFVSDAVPPISKKSALPIQKELTNATSVTKNPLVEASSAVAAPTKSPLEISSDPEQATQKPRPSGTLPEPLPEVLSRAKTPPAPRISSSDSIEEEPSTYPKIVEGAPLGQLSGTSPSLQIKKTKEDSSDTPNSDTPEVSNESINLIQAATKPVKPSPDQEIVDSNQATRNVIPSIENSGDLTSRSQPEPDPIQAGFDDNAPDTLSSLPIRAADEVAALPNNNLEPSQDENKANITRAQILKLDAAKTSRITLTAMNASWIQIRDISANQLILSKVLLKGHSYQVPDRQGLSLMTGNAGALRISVDGKTVPDVGKLGEIRRKVLLDAESLRQGRAVVE